MIIVCSLSDHKHVCDSVKADHLISVIDPGFEPKTPLNVKNHLNLQQNPPLNKVLIIGDKIM